MAPKHFALNAALNFHYPTENDSAILIRTETGEFHAYGQQCTHLACPVYYQRQRKRLECPCHEGAFDAATGNVLYGPPPRPLDVIEVEVRNGEVVGSRKKGDGMMERMNRTDSSTRRRSRAVTNSEVWPSGRRA